MAEAPEGHAISFQHFQVRFHFVNTQRKKVVKYHHAFYAQIDDTLNLGLEVFYRKPFRLGTTTLAEPTPHRTTSGIDKCSCLKSVELVIVSIDIAAIGDRVGVHLGLGEFVMEYQLLVRGLR